MRIGVTGVCHICWRFSKSFLRANRPPHCCWPIWCRYNHVSIRYLRRHDSVPMKFTLQWPWSRTRLKMATDHYTLEFVLIIWKDFKPTTMFFYLCEGKWGNPPFLRAYIWKCPFFGSASSFHLPDDITKPVLLIGPGTGIAPFRSFWQHWSFLKEQDETVIVGFHFTAAEKKIKNCIFQLPKVWLFFGCRTTSLDLYSDEKQKMIERGVLDKVFLALSREKDVPKVY